MKIRNILSTIILILVLSITVGFSAFVSEMSISNIVADVRLNEDVRITNVELVDSSFGAHPYELDYDIDSIMGNITYENDSDTATYKITFTNFGNVDSYVELVSSIGANWEFSDGSEGVIEALGGTREITVLVFSPDYLAGNYDFKLNFDFSRVFNVSYEYLSNSNEIAIEGKSYSTFIYEYGIEDIEIFMGGRQLSSSEYSYDYGSISIHDVSGDIIFKGPKTLNSVMKMNSVLDTNVNFGSSTGLDVINNITYTRNGTQNDEYPIYYYRGNVTTNNVLFGDFCWKMVRTTDTGGVKLIYNGVPASDGSCDNIGTASQLASTSSFNSSFHSPADVGYMYGTRYEANQKDMTSQTDYYYYGNDVIWRDSGYYLLLGGTMNSLSWSSDRNALAEKYHYTCFGNNSQCENIYYIYYFGDSNYAYYLPLYNGENIEDAKAKMFSNTNDSKIKIAIDNWYQSNMISYTNLLEDVIWCNDRTLSYGPLKSKDTNGTGYSYFGAYARNVSVIVPSLTCPNKNDSFTVSSDIGNGNLTYPVGLLTADEFTLAGSGNKSFSTSSYLHTGEFQWTMTPYYFNYTNAIQFNLYSAGSLNNYSVNNSRGVRPAISLKQNLAIASGDGTVTSPYRIKGKISLDLSYYGYGDVYYEPGMTWEEWVNSEYNNVGFVIDGDYIADEYYYHYIVDSSDTRILASSIINSGKNYSLRTYL